MRSPFFISGRRVLKQAGKAGLVFNLLCTPAAWAKDPAPTKAAAASAPAPVPVTATAPTAAPAPATSVAPAAKGAGKDLSVEQLRALQAKMKSYDALTVDFVQTKFSGLRNKSTQRTGQASFVKPNLFKWVLLTPTREEKIYDGKYFYEYTPQSQSAKRYAPNGTQSAELRQIIDLVLNFDSLLKRYDLIKATEDGDLIKIQLKPKADGELTGVELHFAQKEQFISYLKMQFRTNKNSLAHEFKNPSHAVIPDGTFTLPPSVKISASN